MKGQIIADFKLNVFYFWIFVSKGEKALKAKQIAKKRTVFILANEISA